MFLFSPKLAVCRDSLIIDFRIGKLSMSYISCLNIDYLRYLNKIKKFGYIKNPRNGDWCHENQFPDYD